MTGATGESGMLLLPLDNTWTGTNNWNNNQNFNSTTSFTGPNTYFYNNIYAYPTSTIYIDGYTEFRATPQCLTIPTNIYHLTNKTYVDSLIITSNTGLLNNNNTFTGTNTFKKIIINDNLLLSNSIVSPYIISGNDILPTFTFILASNTTYSTPSFSKLSSYQSITTSNSLCAPFIIKGNSSQIVSFSVPISAGCYGVFVNPTGGVNCKINYLLSISDYVFKIYKDNVLWNTITPIYNSILSTTATYIKNSYQSDISWEQFFTNFYSQFTPDIQTVNATYNIVFECKLNINQNLISGGTTASGGKAFININTSQNSFVNITTGLTLGPTGIDHDILYIVADNEINSMVGAVTVNNIYLNTISPSYSSIPTFSSSQIGYSVPSTLYTNTQINNGIFTIIGKTTNAIPKAGCYTCFWTNATSVLNATSTASTSLYGVILSSSIPTTYSGSSYTEFHNEVLFLNQNNVYTSSSFFNVPSDNLYNVYLFSLVYFGSSILNTASICNLQVIRTC
jgi:hypothetical protein